MPLPVRAEGAEKDLVPKDSALNGMCIASAGDNTALQIVINAAVSTAEQFETALRFSGVSSIYADYELFKPDELVHMAGKRRPPEGLLCRSAPYMQAGNL